MLLLVQAWAAVACIARCKTNGNLVLPWIAMTGNYCRDSEFGCMLGLTGKAPDGISYGVERCVDDPRELPLNFEEQYLDTYYVDFDDYPTCEAYAADAIVAMKDFGTEENEEELKEGQCGCIDIITHGLQEAKDMAGAEDQFCEAFVNRMSPVSRVCKTVNVGIASRVCEKTLGIVGDVVNAKVLGPICGLVVDHLKDSAGLDDQAFYNKGHYFRDNKIDDIAQEVCGILTCYESFSQEAGTCTFDGATSKSIKAVEKSLCGTLGLKNSAFCKAYVMLTGTSLLL